MNFKDACLLLVESKPVLLVEIGISGKVRKFSKKWASEIYAKSLLVRN